MSGSRVLLELVVVFGTAAAVTVVFQLLRLPVVLGYVLAGLLIGPHLPVPLVASFGLVHVLSELGVILLMFTVGLELRISTLARVGLPAALTALFEVALCIASGTLVASALGFAPVEALFAGACLGISSTMLVAKAFEELGWKGGFTEVVYAILVFEDLIAIVLLAVLAGVASGAGLDAMGVLKMIGKLGGFLALLLAGGLLVVPRFVRWLAARARPETLLIVALFVCFGAAAVAEHAGYSVALGAFLAGVLVAESGHGHEVFHLVQPFRDTFAMMFFVSVGMSIDPAQLGSQAHVIALFTLVVIAAKPVGIALAVFFSGKGVRPAVRAGVSLSQIGELSFVIAGIGATSGVARSSLLAIAVGVCCVTTLTSGIAIRKSEDIASWVARRLPRRLGMFVSFYEAWLGRLRQREATPLRKLRRPITVLVLDTGLMIVIVIAGATLGPRVTAELGLTGWVARLAIIPVVLAIGLPVIIAIFRRIVVIARLLAVEVIPSSIKHELPQAAAAVDLGLAPRRALILVFELAIGGLVMLTFVAVTQPFIPFGALVIPIVALVFFLIARRSLRDFDGHVRAGSEVILELLSQPPQPGAPQELAQVETVLPGFGGLASITLVPGSPAIGKSLAELDLRAKTGATVLAIARGASGMATPSPTEPLQQGDVLAMAGSDEAIEAARELFGAAAAAAPASLPVPAQA
jgi:CPA2 family monovalent cation:H+ antiporter-2